MQLALNMCVCEINREKERNGKCEESTHVYTDIVGIFMIYMIFIVYS